jgi:hypothetical protein
MINLFPLLIGIPNPFRSSSLTVKTIDAFQVSPGSRLSRMQLGARAHHYRPRNHQSCREAGKPIMSNFFQKNRDALSLPRLWIPFEKDFF